MLEDGIPRRSDKRISIAHRGDAENKKVWCFEERNYKQKQSAEDRHYNDCPGLII
jgi:hypothetical protein